MRNASKSSGSSLSNSKSSPVTGWVKPSVAACSAWRPSRLDRRARLRRKPRDLRLEARAIGQIADQRMADMRHMHADLMRAARLQPTGQQRRGAEILEPFPMGDRLAPARGGDHRHALALRRVAADRRVDRPLRALGRAPGEGEIVAREIEFAAVILEEFRETGMRRVGLGDDDEPACILVDAMHDAGLLDAANAGETLAAMRDERIDQRAALMPRRRMHDEARGLVHHEKMRILEDDVERNVLALRRGGLGLGQRQRHSVACGKFCAGVARRMAVQRRGAGLEQRLHARARDMRGGDLRPLCEITVKPRSRLFCSNDEGEGGVFLGRAHPSSRLSFSRSSAPSQAATTIVATPLPQRLVKRAAFAHEFVDTEHQRHAGRELRIDGGERRGERDEARAGDARGAL